MSTRYVWDRFVAKVDYETYIDGESTTYQVSLSTLECGEGYNIVNGKFQLTGRTGKITSGNSSIAGIYASAIPYRYVLYGSKWIFYAKNPTSNDYWRLSSASNNKYNLILSPLAYDERSTIQLLGLNDNGYVKGDFIDKKSSNLSNTYPNNGVSSDGWYSLLGSDIIDPNFISYSNSNPQAGNAITISISVRSPIYGGTVYYQYQYSINNGSTWTNIGSKTTATNVSVTIPTNATQFKARVLASDNLGFTSTTYVVGDNLTVQTSGGDNYIGIGGTARQIDKIYIGIGGTAREVTEGYIGIGGTARKFYG